MLILKTLHRWLMADRIRISSHTGEMLRLEYGQRVIVDDSLWIVTERQPINDGNAVGVRYHLVSHDGLASLGKLTTPPILCDLRDWVVKERTETSVWLDCYL